jgi:EamA-like transporter family protein
MLSILSRKGIICLSNESFSFPTFVFLNEFLMHDFYNLFSISNWLELPLNIDNYKVLLGWICVFGSAFFFYLATVIVKYSSINGIKIDPAFFVFPRFLLGFISVLVVMMFTQKKINIVKKRYLIGRTVFNCIAVYCFFMGVDLTSVSQANILNM